MFGVYKTLRHDFDKAGYFFRSSAGQGKKNFKDSDVWLHKVVQERGLREKVSIPF